MVQRLAHPRRLRLGDQILKALTAGDGTAARQAMQRHVVSTERGIRRALVELGVRAEMDSRPDGGDPENQGGQLVGAEIRRHE